MNETNTLQLDTTKGVLFKGWGSKGRQKNSTGRANREGKRLGQTRLTLVVH